MPGFFARFSDFAFVTPPVTYTIVWLSVNSDVVCPTTGPGHYDDDDDVHHVCISEDEQNDSIIKLCESCIEGHKDNLQQFRDNLESCKNKYRQSIELTDHICHRYDNLTDDENDAFTAKQQCEVAREDCNVAHGAFLAKSKIIADILKLLKYTKSIRAGFKL